MVEAGAEPSLQSADFQCFPAVWYWLPADGGRNLPLRRPFFAGPSPGLTGR